MHGCLNASLKYPCYCKTTRTPMLKNLHPIYRICHMTTHAKPICVYNSCWATLCEEGKKVILNVWVYVDHGTKAYLGATWPHRQELERLCTHLLYNGFLSPTINKRMELSYYQCVSLAQSCTKVLMYTKHLEIDIYIIDGQEKHTWCMRTLGRVWESKEGDLEAYGQQWSAHTASEPTSQK